LNIKLRILILLGASFLLYGCATVKPWEKEGLSDPIMIIDENPINAGIKEHFLDYREGVEGATGAESGGCGCG
jgi:hypothetical protein